MIYNIFLTINLLIIILYTFKFDKQFLLNNKLLYKIVLYTFIPINIIALGITGTWYLSACINICLFILTTYNNDNARYITNILFCAFYIIYILRNYI